MDEAPGDLLKCCTNSTLLETGHKRRRKGRGKSARTLLSYADCCMIPQTSSERKACMSQIGHIPGKGVVLHVPTSADTGTGGTMSPIVCFTLRDQPWRKS